MSYKKQELLPTFREHLGSLVVVGVFWWCPYCSSFELSVLCVIVCFIRPVSCMLGARVVQWVRSLDLTTHTSLSPIRCGFAPGFVNYKKGALDSQPQVIKVYQLLAHGRWFSPGTLASPTTKTGRHDIAEILLKVALNTKNQSINPNISNQSKPKKLLSYI